MSHDNRRRLCLAPLSVNPYHGLLRSVPHTCDGLAYVVGSHPLAPHGVLVRVRSTGYLAIWRGVRLESVVQRKAQAAMDYINDA